MTFVRQFLLFFLLLGITLSASAQMMTKNLIARNYDPVIVSTAAATQFHGKPISQMFLYAYDAAQASWRVVPFQIDERDGRGSYFGSDDGLLDEHDELVALLRDMGDQVPDGYWIENEASRMSVRYEIEVEDTLRTGNKAWAYLVHSSTISDFNFEDYLTYDAANDRINSKYYEVGFDNNFGLPTHYSVTQESGGTNVDVLDRMKVRIDVNTSAVGSVTVNEDDFIKQEISDFPNSQVRYIRNMRTRLRVVLTIGVITLTVLDEDSIYVPIYCYPYHMNVTSDEIDLNLSDLPFGITADLRVIRNSQDYNSQASLAGMNFFSAYNPTPTAATLIDGQGDSTGIDRTLMAPDLNWSMVTGSPGTILVVNWVPDLGDKQELYFWDKLTGGTMDRVGGNGDVITFGDSGFLLTGASISGSFSLLNNTYLLPPLDQISLTGLEHLTLPAEIGEVFRDNLASPVKVSLNEQMFDDRPPGMVQDLRVISSTDSSLTVGWTAPGDDEDVGQARQYDIRYATVDPGVDLGAWFAAAKPVMPSIAPAVAGSAEVLTLQGLDPDSTYYLVMTADDEAGNISPFSNIVSDIVLSVEGIGSAIVSVPAEFALHQNYPNPFNPTTTMSYEINEQRHVRLMVYNLAGQQVATLVDAVQPPGRHEIRIDASHWPSGVYVVRLLTDVASRSRKILLLR